MGAAFHENLRQAFLTIARQEPGRCAVVNADRPIEELHEEIAALVTERLLLKE